MSPKRNSLLNTSKSGTTQRASFASKPGTPRMPGTPKADTPAVNGSAKKRKSMAQDTPSRKKSQPKEDVSDEDSSDDQEMPKQQSMDQSLVNTSHVKTSAVIASDKGSVADKLAVPEGDSDDSDDEAEVGSEEKGSDSSGEEEESALEEEGSEDSSEGVESDTKEEDEKVEEKKTQAGEVSAEEKYKPRQIGRIVYDDKSIFVRNIPGGIEEREIGKIFSKYGTIEDIYFTKDSFLNNASYKKLAAMKPEYHTVNAFIAFTTKESALKAFQEQVQVLNGHHLTVNLAIYIFDKGYVTVNVHNLLFDTTEEELYNHFSSCGNIAQIKLARDKETGIGKGSATVSFRSTDAVELALLKNGEKFMNESLTVIRGTHYFRKERIADIKFKNLNQHNHSMGEPRKGCWTPKNYWKIKNKKAALFQRQKHNNGRVNKNRNPRKMLNTRKSPRNHKMDIKKENGPAASDQHETPNNGRVEQKIKKEKVVSARRQKAHNLLTIIKAKNRGVGLKIDYCGTKTSFD